MRGHERTIKGEQHVVVVLLVTERDPYGRPKRATILYDEDKVSLKGGEEFVTAFVPKVAVGKTGN